MQMNTHKYGHGETRNKKSVKRGNDITQGWQFCSLSYRLGKRKGKEKEKKIITTWGVRFWSPIHAVTPPNRAYHR